MPMVGSIPRGTIAFTPPADVEGAAFRFALFAPTPRHRMAVAVRRVDDDACRIVAQSADANRTSGADLPLLPASTP